MAMSKTATQIVAKLLEYGIDPDAPRPGSPEDPWRQSHVPVDINKLLYALRPGEPLPDEDADLSGLEDEPAPPPEAATPPAAPLPKHKSRFTWKPPYSESLLHELGGYYCYTCQQPTSPVVDGATGKLNCDKCGAEINYSHPKLSPPRDKPRPDERRRDRPFPQHKPI